MLLYGYAIIIIPVAGMSVCQSYSLYIDAPDASIIKLLYCYHTYFQFYVLTLESYILETWLSDQYDTTHLLLVSR